MKLLLTISFLISCLAGKAQLPDYYVYLVKGNITIKKTGGKAAPVKQQKLVYKSDLLALKARSELTLVDKDANFILLKASAATTGKVADLVKNTTPRSSAGITSKYLKLLFHELIAPDHDYAEFKKENLAEVSGSVSRGECHNLIFPIEGLKTAQRTISFTWLKNKVSTRYNLIIYDGKGSDIKFNVADTQTTLSLSGYFDNKAGKFYWLVKGNADSLVKGSDECNEEIPVSFEIITKENESKQVAALVAKNPTNDLAKYLANWESLEKKGLIYSALDYSSNIIKANPRNPALLKMYVLFLLKYGFDKEATLAWEKIGGQP